MGGERLRVFWSTDHAGVWPVGTASVVVARDEAAARAQLDAELAARRLSTADYTLTELPLDRAVALILRGGDY